MTFPTFFCRVWKFILGCRCFTSYVSNLTSYLGARGAFEPTMLFVVSTSITEPAIGMEFLRLQVHGHAGGDEECLLVCLKVFGVDEVAFADAAGIFLAKFVE